MKKYKCNYTKCRKMLPKPEGRISYCSIACRSKAEKIIKAKYRQLWKLQDELGLARTAMAESILDTYLSAPEEIV